MTRIWLVGVDDESGRGGRLLSCQFQIAKNDEAVPSPGSPGAAQLRDLLKTANRAAVNLLKSWDLEDCAEELDRARIIFSVDEAFFSGRLTEHSYGVALAAGHVNAVLGIDDRVSQTWWLQVSSKESTILPLDMWMRTR
jgi:hypothetical protein